MFTEDILAEDRAKLRQVNEAIASLSKDKRPKAQGLLKKLQELRENLKDSIKSNETALLFEQQINISQI